MLISVRSEPFTAVRLPFFVDGSAAESNRMKEYLEKAFPNQLEYHIGNERHEACADPSKNSWIEIICYNGDSECVENAMRDFWKLNRMSQ